MINFRKLFCVLAIAISQWPLALPAQQYVWRAVAMGGGRFVRIDDDRHQSANANIPMIIGDPRIYGRVYFTTGWHGVIYGNIKK